MNTASTVRKQTSFRLSENLLARLQEEAKRHNRSLNNLVESVLMAFISERPNKTTIAAMKEAETSENLETLDLKSFRRFSMNILKLTSQFKKDIKRNFTFYKCLF